MPVFWRSLSFRLGLAYACLLCLSMAALSAAYYWIAVERPLEEIRTQVQRESRVLSQLYIIDGEAALLAALDRRARRPDPRRAFHAFLLPAGKRVSGNLPSWPARVSDTWYSIEADVYREGDEEDFSALSRDHLFRNGARLIVGRDAEEIEDREEVVLMALPWLLGLTILFGISGGLFMSRAIGRRLDSISSVAQQVIAGDLGGRVAVAGKGDDFDRLAGTLNFMLERNQQLFEAVRRVSDNVAHELRTPLARLVTRLEALQHTCAGLPAAGLAIESALAEADRLQTIFNALLRIARIEDGAHKIDARHVEFVSLAVDAVDLYAPAADEKGVDLHLEADRQEIAGRADPDLIFQALVNLLDNAVKHTPAGGSIRLMVSEHAEELVFEIADSGPGIRPDEAARVTERFFRGEASEGLPGEGLGLSLVAAIASAHRGRLMFHTGPTGFRAVLTVPCYSRI